MVQPKQILLVDLDDARRATRVRILQDAGYEIQLRSDCGAAEKMNHEDGHHLVLVAAHQTDFHEAASYADRLRQRVPALPVLLLADAGVFVPQGTLSQTLEAGNPPVLLKQIAAMLEQSSHHLPPG
jgi:DNA-binding NtrC family response regulator